MNKPFENIHEFEMIFKEYFTPLTNYINKYLNNIENSKEVVQNTFMKIWESKDFIEIQTSIKSYLFQASKNSMIDFIRKNGRSMNVDDIDDVSTNHLIEDENELINPLIIRSAVEKALEKLKPKNKEIFVLHKFEGLTYLEIADYLDISKRTVEDNIARTLKFLNEELKNNKEIFN